MLELNRRASEIACEFKVDAMTDITGFGLVGHATEVAKASHISVEIDHARLPLLPGAVEYSRARCCAGGLTSNREFFGSQVEIRNGIAPEIQNILFDPQTSGGLLIFCQPQDFNPLLQKLQGEGVDAVEIGAALESRHVRVVIL
jgi:selenide,water dikinase